MKKFLLTVLLISTLASCTTSSSLGRGKTGSAFTVSGYTYDQVWDAALQGTMSVEDLKIDKTDKAAGRIDASRGFGLTSAGEVVGVFIDPTKNSPTYKIEVEGRAKVKGAAFGMIAAADWEDQITSAIKMKLNHTKK